MGLLFGPLYGLFIYFYITHLILAGSPFTLLPEDIDTNNITNVTEPEYTPIMEIATSHYIGAGVGSTVGLGLTLSSLYSPRTRCR